MALKAGNGAAKNPVVTGRTWADLVSGVPLWLLGIAAIMFAGVLIYSITLAGRPYSLGILGTFGPSGASEISVTTVAKEVDVLRSNLQTWSGDPAVPGNPVGGGDARPATECPKGYYAAGINWWGAPGSTRYCVGCLSGIQVICRKLNAN